MFQKLRKIFIAGNGFNFFCTDTSDKDNKYRYYKSSDLLYFVDYLLRISYCIFSGTIFKQSKGVPHGGISSLLLAYLTMPLTKTLAFKKTHTIRVIMWSIRIVGSHIETNLFNKSDSFVCENSDSKFRKIGLGRKFLE